MFKYHLQSIIFMCYHTQIFYLIDESLIISMKKIEEHMLFYFLSYLNPIALIETITVEIDIRTAAIRGSI